jgi:hypothetical protein
VLVTLGIVSCGGGGGGSVAGIDRLGVSSGTITGFGSIFVNGVEWETNGASITVDDIPGIESDLRVGQVVVVRGELNSTGTGGTADTVEFDSSLEGPITGINLAAGSFIVLGQTVITSADTTFDDSIPDRLPDGQRTLDDLAAGDVVEVSGFRDAQGAVRATRVEIRAGGPDEFEVKGVVSSFTATTFQIGTLQVNYAGAVLEDFGSDALGNDDFVEVEGSLISNVLVATRVELEDSLPGEDGDNGELEGLITSFSSATNFAVNGVPVTTNSGTEFERGTSADLALNVKVEVEGEVNASGILVADKVEFRVQAEDTDVEIVGDVASVNAANGTLTIEGMDITIRVDEATRLEDESDANMESFSLANLVPGDHVEIRGAEDSTTAAINDVIATRLEREDADGEVLLRGAVQAINQPDLSILGVTVATDFVSDFYGLNDNIINEATFFATIAVGDVVKATTTPDSVTGNLFIADEVEIEELD